MKYASVNASRWTFGARAVVRLIVVGVLLLWGATCTARGQAHFGTGWSPPIILFDDVVDTYNSTLISDQFGAAHLVWKPWGEEVCYYSRWNGAAWTVPIDIIASTSAAPLARPAMVVAADGSLHLFWAQQSIWHSWAWAADAASSARFWSTPEVILTPNGSASGPMDAKQDRFGVFHLAFSLTGGDVYYTHSASDDTSWTEATTVSQAAGTASTGAPRLDIAPDGGVHAIWDQWPSGAGPDVASEVYYARSTDGGVSWTVPHQFGEVANRGGNVLVASEGLVYLAWQAGINSPNMGRFVQQSSDGGSSWQAPANFSYIKAQSGYPSMGLDSQGILHIVTGDGEYVFWDGRSMSRPVDLRPLPQPSENARLAVVNGNQVLVVIGPHESSGLYYTVKQLPLPAAPTVTMSAPSVAKATPSPVSTDVSAAPGEAPTAVSAVQNGGSLPAGTPASSTIPTLILSAALSLVVVAGVVVFHLWRRHV